MSNIQITPYFLDDDTKLSIISEWSEYQNDWSFEVTNVLDENGNQVSDDVINDNQARKIVLVNGSEPVYDDEFYNEDIYFK